MEFVHLTALPACSVTEVMLSIQTLRIYIKGVYIIPVLSQLLATSFSKFYICYYGTIF